MKDKIMQRILESKEGDLDLPDRIKKPIRKRQHSLGDHPALPESDEVPFEEKILKEKYKRVVDDFKKNHNVDTFKDKDVLKELMKTKQDVSEMEVENKENLENLAIEKVKDSFDISENNFRIEAELSDNIENEEDGSGKEVSIDDLDLENEDQKRRINREVDKRRFVNNLIEGSAHDIGNMMNEMDLDITDMNPRLSNNYKKLMSEIDYENLSGIGLILNVNSKKNNKNVQKAGDVDVKMGTDEIPVIKAKGVTLPILLHELTKGIMEYLSLHGLPDDQQITNFIINKADKEDYEPWDLILGPCIWDRFTSMMGDENKGIQQYLFSEITELTPDEFDNTMKEVLGGTQKGQKYIQEMSDDIKNELQHEEYERTVENFENEFNGVIEDPSELDKL